MLFLTCRNNRRFESSVSATTVNPMRGAAMKAMDPMMRLIAFVEALPVPLVKWVMATQDQARLAAFLQGLQETGWSGARLAAFLGSCHRRAVPGQACQRLLTTQHRTSKKEI